MNELTSNGGPDAERELSVPYGSLVQDMESNSFGSGWTTHAIITNDSIHKIEETIKKRDYLYYRISYNVKDVPYYIVSTNRTQLLFISAFSEFFTAGYLTKEFSFIEVEIDEKVAELCINTAKGRKESARPPAGEDESEFWAMNLDEASRFNLEVVQYLAAKTNITANNFEVCAEENWDWFSVGLDDSKRQYLNAKTYHCCTTTNGNECGYKKQDLVLSLVHVIFALFKFTFALIFLKFVVRKRKFYFMPKAHAIHVTNLYYNPPFWLARIFPRKKWAYDIRNWVTLNIIFIVLLLFAINIIHCFVPVDWEKNNRSIPIISPGEFFSNVHIGTNDWWGLWAYGIFVLPITLVLVSATMVIKLCSRKISINEIKKKHKERKRQELGDASPKTLVPPMARRLSSVLLFVVERVLRVIVCSVLSLVMAVAVIFLLLRSYDIYEYNEVFVFLHGLVLWIIGVGYLYFSKTTQLFSNISDGLLRSLNGLKKNSARSSVYLKEPLLLNDAERGDESPVLSISSSSDDVTSSTASPATEQPTASGLVQHISREFLFSLRFMAIYQVPSLIFETLWFAFSFFSAFLASSFICRFVWSLLLLFILYPERIQVGVYCATILGTLVKFVIDLSSPHAKLRAKILDEKPLLPLGFGRAWNKYIVTLKQEDLFFKHEVNETPKYFVFLTWKDFFKIAKEVKTSYFIFKILGKATFTIFVISLFFMGFVVFGQGDVTSSAGEMSDSFLKLAALTLLPILPKVVELLEGKDVVEEATYNARFRSAVVGVEYGAMCPGDLQSFTKKDAGKQGLSPILALCKPVGEVPPEDLESKKRPKKRRTPKSDVELEDQNPLTEKQKAMIRKEVQSKEQASKSE